MRDSRVRSRYGVSVGRSRARVLTLFCPRTPSSWTGAPRTLSWPRPTGPRAGRPRRSPSRSAASGMNHRGTSLRHPHLAPSPASPAKESVPCALCLSSCSLCWRGWPSKTQKCCSIFPPAKRNAMTGVGATGGENGGEILTGGEDRTCARGTGGFGNARARARAARE